MEKPLIIRGRTIASADIELIRFLSNKYHRHGKTFISRKLAEAWKWVQANGRLKDRACRDILSALERKDIIALRSLRQRPKQNILPMPSPASIDVETSLIEGAVSDLRPFTIELVSPHTFGS